MNKYELAKKINELEGLTNDEKSELIKLLRSQKKYGLVWEDKPEDAEQRMVNEQPVLVEVPERAILSDEAEAPKAITSKPLQLLVIPMQGRLMSFISILLTILVKKISNIMIHMLTQRMIIVIVLGYPLWKSV